MEAFEVEACPLGLHNNWVLEVQLSIEKCMYYAQNF